jgi:repressor LexA
VNTSKEVIALIKKLRLERKMSVEELANKVGVAKSTQSRYENGQREFPINDIGKYAEALGTTVQYLLGIENIEKISEKDSVRIPILGEIACGEPIFVQENFEGYIVEPKESLPPGDLYYVKAKGDSMEPTIPNGSKVMIRKQSDVESNEIAAVLVNGDTEVTLKRVRKQNDSVILMPDNPKYNPIIVNEHNPAKIIGKAIRYTFDL